MLMPVLSELIKRREVSDIQHASRIAHHATKLKVGRKIDLATGKGGDSNENMDTALESLKSRRTVDEVDYDTSLLPDRDDFPPPIRGDASLVEMEDDYWNKFEMDWEGHDFPAKAGPATGEYLSEGAAREWSTVVKIYITLLSFKPVSLYLSRSPLSKTPKQVFFNPINIF